jgi:hypothetical protein
MPDIGCGKTTTQPPQSQLIQMATAHWVSRLLCIAAQINLADHLAEGPKTAEELAQLTATAAPPLYRMMRTLASLGVFTEDSGHRFSLTHLGEALKTGTPGSLRPAVLTMAGDIATRSLDHLLYSIQTGKTGFEKAFGMPLFEWLSIPSDGDVDVQRDHGWTSRSGTCRCRCSVRLFSVRDHH